MKGVFITDAEKELVGAVYSGRVREAIGREIELYPDIVGGEEVRARRGDWKGTEYIFSTWGMPSLSEEEIAADFPKLKAVFYAAGSVQEFARPFLRAGVKVVSAWAANAVPVAEYTVAQIVLANKGILRGIAMMKTGGYDSAYRYALSFPGTYGGAVGLLGCGMVGSLVAEMLRAYRLEVLAFDPFLSGERAKELGVVRTPLEEIFAECQTISNHLANNARTVGMLDYKLFGRMKDNAAFINTGRGAQVVEADLIRAMRECPGRTALLDVTWPEPPEPDSELYTLDNVFLTPHIAGCISGERARLGDLIAEEFAALRQGRSLRYEVSLPMLETMA